MNTYLVQIITKIQIIIAIFIFIGEMIMAIHIQYISNFWNQQKWVLAWKIVMVFKTKKHTNPCNKSKGSPFISVINNGIIDHYNSTTCMNSNYSSIETLVLSLHKSFQLCVCGLTVTWTICQCLPAVPCCHWLPPVCQGKAETRATTPHVFIDSQQ